MDGVQIDCRAMEADSKSEGGQNEGAADHAPTIEAACPHLVHLPIVPARQHRTLRPPSKCSRRKVPHVGSPMLPRCTVAGCRAALAKGCCPIASRSNIFLFRGRQPP